MSLLLLRTASLPAFVTDVRLDLTTPLALVSLLLLQTALASPTEVDPAPAILPVPASLLLLQTALASPTDVHSASVSAALPPGLDQQKPCMWPQLSPLPISHGSPQSPSPLQQYGFSLPPRLSHTVSSRLPPFHWMNKK